MMNLDGELAVLLIETWDSDGIRRLSHTQFEATADLIVENNDTRMDISLNTFESLERWEDGVRVDQLSKMIGEEPLDSPEKMRMLACRLTAQSTIFIKSRKMEW